MCWIQSQLIISLGRHNASNTLTSLNLEGYEELNDLVLEFIAGVEETSDENSTEYIENEEVCRNKKQGLLQLKNLTLPIKSFVTPHGLKILLENLLRLETIRNSGRLGKGSFNKILKLSRSYFLVILT